MPFDIRTRCFPAEISDNHINCITHIDTSPDIRAWEKMKAFFGHTQQPEALECIRTIYHPPLGTTREDISNRFEQLRRLAHSGYQENIQSGRHGKNHLCILDANNHEILSVTLDDTGSYTLECEGDRKIYTIATPQTAEDYDAIWSAWEKAASPEEASNRTAVVEKMRRCLQDNFTTLGLRELDLKTLPDYLPPNILELDIRNISLTRLPALPSGLQHLMVSDTKLTSLPTLPAELQRLMVSNTELTSLPTLPAGLNSLKVESTPLTSLPVLPSGLINFQVIDTELTSLPELPSGIWGMEVNNTPLTSLPALPSGLLSLVVEETSLTSLPTLPSGLQTLQVSSSPLTCLPTLPSGLQELQVSSTPLTSLPALPSGLLRLVMEETSLTSLPALPSGLQELQVSDSPLTCLPALPSGLQELQVSSTPLTCLPALPSGLQELQVSSTPLTSLPALPSGLQKLQVSSTPLTSLPALSSGLQKLQVSDSPMTSLPTLPSGLQRLELNNTSLTSLPESITRLSPQAEVDLRNNPLTERTLLALRNMTRDPDYSGPRMHFSMRRASAPQEVRPLHLAVAGWLVPDNEGKRAASDRWQDFGQQDNASSFSRFLDRLSETKNVKTDPGFKTQIATWLTHLAEDDELRAKTFAMATEASSSCEDRITLTLNHMTNVQLVHRAEKGEFDKNHPGLVAVGREMFRLEKLEQIAREKVSTLYFIDEIEVYLAYQNKLKEPLELSCVTKEMRFFDVAGVTESDLQIAEIQVKTVENNHFMEWILQWAPLQSMLQRKKPALWKTLSEKKVTDYNDIYRMLSDTELKPAGLLDNDDAASAIGARAMESAEKAFLDELKPLVTMMLAGYLDPRWP